MEKVKTQYLSWISDKGLGMLIMVGVGSTMFAAIVTGLYWVLHR